MFPQDQVREKLKSHKGRVEIWEEIKRDWQLRLSPESSPISGDLFASLFYDGEVAEAAIAFVASSQVARDQLRQAAAAAGSQALSDGDRRRVTRAVFEEADWPLSFWRDARRLAPSAGEAKDLAEAFVHVSLKQEGRVATRRILAEIWDEMELEEEREAALIAFCDATGPLDPTFVRSLGTKAVELAQRLDRWGRLRIDGKAQKQASLRASGGTAPLVLQRISALLHPVRIAVDLKDSYLWPEEVESLATGSARGLADLLDEAGLVPREVFLERLARARGTVGLDLRGAPEGAAAASFPLLQIFHLRELLSAPSLSKGLADPQDYLLPTIFQRLLDLEPVS